VRASAPAPPASPVPTDPSGCSTVTALPPQAITANSGANNTLLASNANIVPRA
jgi:hypothetical protein